MFEALNHFSLSTSSINEDQARRVIGSVNDRLHKMLRAPIIDVVWKRDLDGGILLEPLAKFSRSEKDRGIFWTPKPQFILDDGTSAAPGIWSWVYKNRKPVWLEDTRTIGSEQAVVNLADYTTPVPPEYLTIFPETGSLMAVPLITKGSVRGVYSIELDHSGIFSQSTLKFLMDISRPIARIIWKSEAVKFHLEHMDRVVNLFATAIGSAPDNLLSEHRLAFSSRPFEDRFLAAQGCIGQSLIRHGIQLEHYAQLPGAHYVLEDVGQRIRRCHFAVVNTTGQNPNVMTELGMLARERKEMLILQEKEDTGQPLFAIEGFPFFSYAMRDGGMVVWNLATQRFVSLDEILDPFVEHLEKTQVFGSAKKWGGHRE